MVIRLRALQLVGSRNGADLRHAGEMALETQRKKLSQLAKVLTLTPTHTPEPQNIQKLTANLFLRGFHDSGPPQWNQPH